MPIVANQVITATQWGVIRKLRLGRIVLAGELRNTTLNALLSKGLVSEDISGKLLLTDGSTYCSDGQTFLAKLGIKP